MRRVLITGMTSRCVTDRRPYALCSLMRDSLVEQGHTVDLTAVRVGSAATDVAGYDAVLAGISSVLAPSATYAMTGLITLSHAIEAGNLRAVIIDDPDIRRVRHGAASAARERSRLYARFFQKRTDMASISASAELRDRVASAIEWILDGDWPAALWPAHAWADPTPFTLHMPRATRPIGLDPTGVVLDRIMGTGPQCQRTSMWLQETRYAAPLISNRKVLRQPVMTIKSDESAAPVEAYSQAYGVLQGQPGEGSSLRGWWTPTPAVAVTAGALLAMHPEEGVLAGGPLYTVPQGMETMDDKTHRGLAAAQRFYLEEKAWTKQEFSTHLSGVLTAPGD